MKRQNKNTPRSRIAELEKELEIEAALEQVRARTMAMRHSDELAETAYILFRQFRELGENPDQATIGIINEGEGVIEYWVTIHGSQTNRVFKFPVDEPNVTRKIYKAWKKHDKSLVIDLSGKALRDFSKFRASMGGAGYNPDEKRRIINVAFFSKGLINVQSTVERSVESLRLLERFANVFEGTYTRFLDLKKAEAQTRESQIELALERVRAKTMAMQHSDELLETSQVVFQQLRDLGETADQISIGIVKEEEGIFDLFATIYGTQMVRVVHPKIDDHFIMGRVYKNWKAHKKSFVIELGGEDLRRYNILRNQLGGRNYYNENIGPDDRWIVSCASFSRGILSFSSSTEPTKEAAQLLERFARVFDSTYTRFLDLQRAEAQAREAKIEVALERTRTQSILMQHSSELDDVLLVFHQQVSSLGIPSAFSFLWLPDEEKDRHIFWAAWAENESNTFKSKAIDYPLDRNEPATALCLIDWKGSNPVVSYHLPPEGVGSYFAAWQELIDGVERLKPEYFAGGLYYVEAFMKYGCFGVMMENDLGEAEKKVLNRFAVEFERTYTRFLDLKKAEAQAREGQIQLAMERVRARTMAMQRSDELPETANLLFKQVQELGMPAWSAGYCNWTDNKKAITFWMSSEGVLQPPFSMPTTTDPSSIHMREAAERGETFYVEEVGGEALVKHYDYMRTLPVVGEVLDAIINAGHPLPIFQIFHLAYFAHGFLLFITYESVPQAHDIFKRFATVFEQTYTRFLDLQKAEAQAREAEIELGLERVRARTMAMQKSGELQEIIKVVYEQLVHLNIPVEHAGFIIDYNTRDDMHIWLADKHYAPTEITVPYFDSPHWNGFNEAKQKGSNFFAIYSGFEEKNKFYQDLFKLIPGVTDETKEYYFSCPGLAISTVLLENVGLYIENFAGIPYTDDENSTLMRFGKVFQQTYTRFKDLEQAEAQARESQIQLALERVRARTSAMQKSDELAEVIQVVHDQLYQLDFNINNANFILDYNESDGMNCWAAVQGALYAIKIQIPYYDDTVNNYFNSVKAKGPGLYITTFSAEEKNRFFERIFACNPWMSTERTPLVFGGPGYAWSTVLMKNIALTVQNYSGTPYSDAENEIIKRFGTVFEQTYTRFNDLKQAEEQARESQIQLALERVRARTSAMQKSDELREAIKLIFEQLLQLNFNIDVANFALNCKESDDFNLWLAVHGQQYPTKIHIPYFDHPIFNIFVEAKEKGKDFYAFTCTFEEKNEFFDHFFKNSPKVDEERKEAVYSSPGYAQSTVLMKTISLAIINYAAIPYSEAENMMLKRFGKVFEQTYTRFLDLQQAEAQVREAQVQLALERVRARTMAMHQSIELAETSEVLFQQFAGLGIVPERVVIGIMIENPRKIDLWGTEQGGNKMGVRFELREDWTVGFDKVYNAWEDKKKNLTIVLKDKDLDHHVHYMRDVIGMPMQLELIHQQRVLYAAFFTKGFLMMAANEAEPKETLDILERFAGVFNLTYTRFLDLQKAEEQAREARIETSLERVRSKAMAMRSSEDLADAIGVFYHELGLLSVTPKRCGMGLINKGTRITEISTMNTTEQGDSVEVIGSISLTNHPVLVGIYDNWLLQKEYHPILRGNEIKAYYQLLRPQISYPDYPHDVVQYGYFFFFQDGGVFAWTDTALPEDELQIYRRFNSVLSLTYRRYKDIKDAEAQARESQIQLALERIRARTMAMQKSDELAETAMTLFEQFNELGVKPERIFIGNVGENARTIEFWGTDQGGNQMNPRFEVNADATIGFSQIYKAWKTKKKTHTVIMKGRELADHVRYVQDVLHMPMQPELVQQQRIMYSAFFSKGLLMIVTPEIQSNETIGILERFAGVFDGTYTRFLDLQKAEAQARESQIQLALERVRARTMAMHTSEDVGDTVATMFDELVKLGVEKTVRSGIAIIESAAHMELWTASSIPNEEIALTRGHVNVTIHPLLQGFYNAWKNKEQHFSYELAGDDLKEYYLAMNNSPDYPVHFDTKSLPSKLFHNTFIFPEGAIFIFSSDQLTAEVAQIYKRFAGVFGQTYRRYLDLQKAEAQAREAQIEAALEKVRGKAMAMYNSADLTSTASMVFTELRKLGIEPMRCGISIQNKENRKNLLYSATASEDGHNLSLVGWAPLEGHPVLTEIHDNWMRGEDYFPVLKGDLLKTYYEKIKSSFVVPAAQAGYEQFGYFLAFSEGTFYGWSEQPFTGPEIKILKRFTSVIDLTFRRYIELQKSEASARDAVRAASLDRVRAEIASMRTIADLNRITPLIWNELTILGVPFIRCGVFIMDEAQEVIHTYLSTPDGKAIAAFQLHFSNDSGNGVNGAALRGWREKQMVTLHWTEEEFRNFSHSLKEQGEIISEESYLTERPPTGLDLHFFPFLQGMLYAGNSAPLSDDDKDLVQSLADAFSTAYARYEDFNRLELAKQEVERTLTDLRTAQTRLIQSEKMASLGELTAGIAHEIQNPLNFVNNFSEVNQDLLEELKAESLKPKAERDEQLEIELINDLINNEQKINHHGKRADGIVKGMLQHSRTAGGEKLPTNINSVAEEYMRLSYHGLRAKDKGFNAEMVMNFDPDLPKIQAVGQDIGRVMLNLFNNAFYAVNQKSKKVGAGYKPEVSVSTSAEDGQVIITVKDNGVGMPEQVKEKIMQPFFTTKPTGEGTGLGLSLTYDMVVKGHGGSIKVDSVEGECSEFTISLPIN